ncbi:hypothetical protein Lsha_2801 [Legionella shakespearei DSM 23087]|uniref:Uncharacterized protein n=1 Tax=Legionella shakespearei DSM 23087 TaxID=1122169 RepID=A0A0W0YHS0_9GAMM|nr:hypothetical protein Lsha_2801 [Legionella shakespearei DSM 23087]
MLRHIFPDPRRPERVFLREGSPESGMVPIFGDPSRKKTRSGRRGSGDVDRATLLTLPKENQSSPLSLLLRLIET